jgi:uncharacterized protein (DUF58 family)
VIEMPDAHELRYRAEQLAAKLPPLLVAAERVAATVSQGMHGRRRAGQGETFWQFRQYQPGDSVQAIDWRQTAKRDRVYVRETEWEAAQTVWLWRDASLSMNYHSHLSTVEKRARADLLLLALAALLVRGGEHIALLGEPKTRLSGRYAVERVALAVERESAASHGSGLPEIAALPTDARLVLFGDFLAPTDSVERVVSTYAARGVRGHILQVLDPAEQTLPFEGRNLFEGLENDGRVLVRRTETLRAAYADRMAAHQDALSRLARSSGWSFAVHHTDRAPELALLSLYTTLADDRRR